VNDVVDIDRLVGELAAHDGDTRSLAAEALVGLGAAAVPAVVAALVDETSPVDWAEAGWLLRRIGLPAFQAVRDVIAAAPTREARRRAGWAFVGFGAAALPAYIAATRHPHPQVRANAATGIGYLKAQGLPGAAALIELLADADEYVRERAVGALPQLGMAVLPALQQVRRGGPGSARHGALVALAELAGERGLSQRDRSAITRLIRVKLSRDLPEPFLEGSWLAVPGADQAGIIGLLGLATARPATFALGLSAVGNDAHGWHDPTPPDCGRRVVFITPELAGWTLVIGGVFLTADRGDEAELLRTCRRLAGRYGMAQAFSYDELSGWSAWTVADDHPALFALPGEPSELGRIVRHHVDDDAGDDADIGEPLAVEVACSDRVVDADGAPGRCRAIEVAEALSVNPQQLGPHVPMRGHGLLAITPHGIANGMRAGALQI
jgi:HEAT repeats